MDSNAIYFKRLTSSAQIPKRATQYSAGYDLYADEDVSVSDGNHCVRTGVAVRLPPGTYGRIAIRSGLAKNQHLNVSAGVIDRDYSGEIAVIVHRTKPGSYDITAGERFAQLIVERIADDLRSIEVDELPRITATMQDHIGFGSTGST